MTVESLQRTSFFLFWLSIILPTLGALAAVGRFYVDREEKRISTQRATELREDVETLADYAETARLNFIGTYGMARGPLVEQSAISRTLQNAITLSENRVEYKCDDASIQIFNDVAARFPRFPFSHYALALCLQQRGDATWRDHAAKAVEILKRTTKIEGHHPNHDDALQELLQALGS